MFSLEFKPRVQHVGAARLFAAAVARHHGCEPEDVEDLKIAVSEACGRATQGATGPDIGPVRLSATTGEGVLNFEIVAGRAGDSDPGPSDGPAGPRTMEQMTALSAELIAVLFPDAEFADGPRGIYFRFSVPAPQAAPA